MIIYANLDQEARWSGVALPAHVMRRLDAMAKYLEVLVDGPASIVVPSAGPPAHWDLAWADPGAKAVNDRRWGLSVAQAAGLALPGARVITSVEELPATPWVAKAPWTSAGRDRAREPVQAAQLLARHGALVLEPWMERIADVAICATADATLPPHGIVTNRHGGFLGIDLDAVPLEADEVAQLHAAADVAREALAAAGYRGPFGIDAFVHVEGGERRFHAMCELNARHTFGHVAHAWARRTGARKFTPSVA